MTGPSRAWSCYRLFWRRLWGLIFSKDYVAEIANLPLSVGTKVPSMAESHAFRLDVYLVEIDYLTHVGILTVLSEKHACVACLYVAC